MSIIRRPRVESSSCVYMTVCQRHAWRGRFGGLPDERINPSLIFFPIPSVQLLWQAVSVARLCNFASSAAMRSVFRCLLWRCAIRSTSRFLSRWAWVKVRPDAQGCGCVQQDVLDLRGCSRGCSRDWSSILPVLRLTAAMANLKTLIRENAQRAISVCKGSRESDPHPAFQIVVGFGGHSGLFGERRSACGLRRASQGRCAQVC